MEKIQRLDIKLCTAALALFGFVHAFAQPSLQPPYELNGAALLEKHASLAKQLTQNQFGRPLFLQSSESLNSVSGDAYAVIDAPFNAVNTALRNAQNWCDVLILHLNTKLCRVQAPGGQTALAVSVGKKVNQPLKDAYAIEFAYTVAASTSDYLGVRLNAAHGPLGSHDYRINFEAVPIAGSKTFVHLRYSYGYGMAGRLAMQGYLGTIGGRKVGFSLAEDQAAAAARLVGGLRGAIERNTMRYYLAIDVYMASLKFSAEARPEKSFQAWFDATEQYPRQLREIDRTSYLTMKRAELKRQNSLQ